MVKCLTLKGKAKINNNNPSSHTFIWTFYPPSLFINMAVYLCVLLCASLLYIIVNKIICGWRIYMIPHNTWLFGIYVETNNLQIPHGFISLLG